MFVLFNAMQIKLLSQMTKKKLGIHKIMCGFFLFVLFRNNSDFSGDFIKLVTVCAIKPDGLT